jgi:hypothetical protein
MRNSYKISVRKPEGKGPLGRLRHRWEDSIRIDLREIRCEGTDTFYLTQDRDYWQALVNMLINPQVP